jgi:hypothetical protein
LRLRRNKAAIVNLAFRDALTEVATQLLLKPGQWKEQLKDRSQKLAREWFSDPDVKKQIAGLLRKFDLDETAIEAEAFRKSADDLERIDRLIASAEARRDNAHVCIAQYRGDFGARCARAAIDLSTAKFSNGTVNQLQQNSPGAETHAFPLRRLEHAGSKQRKPAA